MGGTTRQVAEWVAGFDTMQLRPEALVRAQHAVLDWTGVAIAGSHEPLVDILVADALQSEENGGSTVVGRREAVSPATAALVNGAASHALDFDDVNFQMHGHPSAVVLPAVLAVAEQREVSGRELLEAFLVGYEVACAVGEMMDPSHYESGWHSTGTVGTLGAAAGAARLMKLDSVQSAHALGTAATQAAGLKAMFGTMCKPLHAGKAAMNGLLAARWAALGMTSNPDGIEAHQGFANTQSSTFTPNTLPESAAAPLAIESGLYKYHAACYLTHSSIEAAKSIAHEHDIHPDRIRRIRLHVRATHRDVCDIAEPRSGLAVKFSIRHLVAMALMGVDTADLGSYSDETALREDLTALRRHIELVPDDTATRHAARVEVEMLDGRKFDEAVDVGVPLADGNLQWQKLCEKFRRITVPVVGETRTVKLVDSVSRLSDTPSAAGLIRAMRG